jgi:hypothetical protein
VRAVGRVREAKTMQSAGRRPRRGLRHDGLADAFSALLDGCDKGDGIMAKKRKVKQATRAKAKPKAPAAARRKAAAPSPREPEHIGGEVDPLNVIAAVLAVALIGLGIYYYQLPAENGDVTGTIAPAAQTK